MTGAYLAKHSDRKRNTAIWPDSALWVCVFVERTRTDWNGVGEGKNVPPQFPTHPKSNKILYSMDCG
jgi:hypothetical protein